MWNDAIESKHKMLKAASATVASLAIAETKN
jgi:hypothetical protein